MSKPTAADKRRAFVLAYLEHENGEAAAIAAGYAPSSAAARASRLLAEPETQAAIAEARAAVVAQVEPRVVLTKERTLRELRRLALSSIDHYAVDPATGEVSVKPGAPQGAIRAVRKVKVRRRLLFNGAGPATGMEITTEIELHPKVPALDLAMRHLGLLVTDTQGDNAGGTHIHVHGGPTGLEVEARTVTTPQGSATIVRARSNAT